MPRKRNNSSKEEEALGIIFIILIVGALIYFLWIKIIHPFLLWIVSNLFWVLLFLGAIFLGGFVFLYWFLRKRKKQRKLKQLYELEQKKKGLVKFVDRFGAERWGTKTKVKSWKKQDDIEREKESLLNQIVEKIKEFKSFKKYSNEFSYQFELGGFLKATFPKTKIEQQRGSSRPDIIIEDIAIEIKGPTSHRDLDSVWSKCGRYYKHFDEFIVVLFDIMVNDRYYEEWKSSLEEHFPKVKIIRK